MHWLWLSSSVTSAGSHGYHCPNQSTVMVRTVMVARLVIGVHIILFVIGCGTILVHFENILISPLKSPVT
ncbi:hypothetical protein TIFTF001_033474 [Ficus carica]|uniref:Uncharacterized protein n=1 Tax=Ficus carica TaxID=3494 RepID=A0AA88J3T0_FICCA|nr:hypothetical protein TIFTF001_033474 [Ficus carica]